VLLIPLLQTLLTLLAYYLILTSACFQARYKKRVTGKSGPRTVADKPESKISNYYFKEHDEISQIGKKDSADITHYYVDFTFEMSIKDGL